MGNAGSGSFTQDNSAGDSSHTVGGSLTLGSQAGSSGSYSLTDTGSGYNVSLAVTGDTIVGDAGSGTFTQSGGTHTVTGNLTLAQWVNSSGTYNLQGGSLVASCEYIGVYGTGTFTQERRHQYRQRYSVPRGSHRRQ